MRIPLSRTKQEIEVENEAHAPLPGCPTPHRLFRPDLLFTSDCSHRSFRAEAEDRAHLAPLSAWKKVEGTWEERLPTLCSVPRGPGL